MSDTAEAMQAAGGDWGIVGVSLKRPEQRAAGLPLSFPSSEIRGFDVVSPMLNTIAKGAA